MHHSHSITRKGEFKMKIAVPTTAGRVEQHFGRSEEFAIVEVAEGSTELGSIETVDARGTLHDHEGRAALLGQHGVQVVIAGGMGYGMFAALRDSGFTVITGAEGTVEEVARAFAMGKLTDKGAVHHGHHHEEHNHAEHHQHGHGW